MNPSTPGEINLPKINKQCLPRGGTYLSTIIGPIQVSRSVGSVPSSDDKTKVKTFRLGRTGAKHATCSRLRHFSAQS